MKVTTETCFFIKFDSPTTIVNNLNQRICTCKDEAIAQRIVKALNDSIGAKSETTIPDKTQHKNNASTL